MTSLTNLGMIGMEMKRGGANLLHKISQLWREKSA
jgi:hypothetical protein